MFKCCLSIYGNGLLFPPSPPCKSLSLPLRVFLLLSVLSWFLLSSFSVFDFVRTDVLLGAVSSLLEWLRRLPPRNRGLWFSPPTLTFGEEPLLGGPPLSAECGWHRVENITHGHTAVLCVGAKGALEVLGTNHPLSGTSPSLPPRPLKRRAPLCAPGEWGFAALPSLGVLGGGGQPCVLSKAD